jgi:hypothetical protein
MNLESLGNLGDFLGGIAVIATLIYIALQVRQNTVQIAQNSAWLRGQTCRSDQNAHVAATQLVASDASLATIYRKGFSDPDTLTEDEWTRLTFYYGLMFGNYQNSLYQYEQGLLDEELWPNLVAIMTRILQSPGGARYWQQSGFVHSAGFREFVGKNILPSEKIANQ